MKHTRDIATLHRMKDRIGDPQVAAHLLEAIARLRRLERQERGPVLVERTRPEGAA